MPNLKIKNITTGSRKWLASRLGLGHAKTGILKVSTFTLTDGYIPSGTAVKTNAQGQYELSTGGSNPVVGHLVNDVIVPKDPTPELLPAAVLLHGTVRAANVPGTFTKPTAANQIAYL